jgi:uncharacterized repeat protein (TIGR01451 family)
MKQQKTSGVSKLVASLLGAALLGLATQNAMALTPGTAAGSTINNTASLTYSVGTVAQNSINSSPTGNSTQNAVTTAVAGAGNGAVTQFLVDYKVDLVVTAGTTVSVTPNQSAAVAGFPTNGAVSVYNVQNFSNATQNFSLAVIQPAGSQAAPVAGLVNNVSTNDAFDTTSNTIYVSNAATFDATAVAASSISDLAPGGIKYVYVVSNVPGSALNGQTALLGLQATALWPTTMPAWATAAGGTANQPIAATPLANGNNVGPTALTVVDIVFADDAGTAGTDVLRDAKHSAYDALTVKSASISVAKSVAVLCDVMNGGVKAVSIPGSAQQYAITIQNTGNAAASLTTVSDLLATTLVINTNFLGGVTGAPISAANCLAGSLAALPSTTATGTSFGFITGVASAVAGSTPGYTAPSAVGGAVGGGAVVPAAGASVDAAGLVAINFVSILTTAVPGPGATVRLANGDLMAGEAVTVYFNTFVQ